MIALGQVAEEIPELAKVHNALFDALDRAETRTELEAAIGVYKGQLASIHERGLVTDVHYNRLIAVLPMRADFAWAKRTGEIGPQAKTPAQWARERGYIKEVVDVGIWDVLKEFPVALRDEVYKQIEELPGFPKFRMPWWAWIGLAVAGLGVVGYFIRSLPEPPQGWGEAHDSS